jgi:hypothetical protein
MFEALIARIGGELKKAGLPYMIIGRQAKGSVHCGPGLSHQGFATAHRMGPGRVDSDFAGLLC